MVQIAPVLQCLYINILEFQFQEVQRRSPMGEKVCLSAQYSLEMSFITETMLGFILVVVRLFMQVQQRLVSKLVIICIEHQFV